MTRSRKRPRRPRRCFCPRSAPSASTPPHRVEADRRKTYELAEQIAEAGGQLTPAHVFERGDGTYDILAGHRRKTALESLGEKHIIAFVHTKAEIPKGMTYARWSARFMKSEGSQEPWTAKDWLYAFYESAGEVISPHAPTAKDIRDCVELFKGRLGLKLLIDNGAAPHVARLGRKLHFAMRDKLGDDVPTILSIASWFVRHGGSNMLSRIEKEGFKVDVLRRWKRAIEKDKKVDYVDLTIPRTKIVERVAPESVRPKAAKRP